MVSQCCVFVAVVRTEERQFRDFSDGCILSSLSVVFDFVLQERS